MRKTYLIALLLASTLSACYSPKYSAVPTPINYEHSNQHVLQAASHWNLINNKVSEELVDVIADKVDKKERILIRPQDSAHSQQLYYDLIKSLTMQGYTVVKYDFKPNHQYRYQHQIEQNKPKHDVVIDIKTEVLKYRGDRRSHSQTGTLTKLAAGAWFLKAWDTTNWGRATGVIIATDTLDYFYGDKNYDGDPPQTEIVIDILASRGDQYLGVSKGVYYVVEDDAHMYAAAEKTTVPLMHDFNLVGAGK